MASPSSRRRHANPVLPYEERQHSSKKGDKVGAGEKIGEVGMSGLSAFPNLEFRYRCEMSASILLPVKQGPILAPSAIPRFGPTRRRLCFPPADRRDQSRFASVKPETPRRQGLYCSSGFSGSLPVMAIWADILWVDEETGLPPNRRPGRDHPGPPFQRCPANRGSKVLLRGKKRRPGGYDRVLIKDGSSSKSKSRKTVKAELSSNKTPP